MITGKDESNEIEMTIPGLDWGMEEVMQKDQKKVPQKKVPYAKPIPAQFQQVSNCCPSSSCTVRICLMRLTEVQRCISRILSSLESISVQSTLLEHSLHISDVLKHSCHLLLCSQCWFCHESFLDLLLFSPPYCHPHYQRKVKNGMDRESVFSTLSVFCVICPFNTKYVPFWRGRQASHS